jgi:hypothetical protein
MDSQPTAQSSELSADARRLLEHLRRWATEPDRAQTDRELAAVLNLPQRDLVDLADELLRHGHMVIARTGAPPGRWILLDGDPDQAHWFQAREYAAGLDARAKGIHARAKHAREALATLEARRQVEPTTGQGRLF